MTVKPSGPETDMLIQFDPQTGGLKVISPDAASGFDVEVDGRFAGVFQPDVAPSRPSLVNRIVDSSFSLQDAVWLTNAGGAERPVSKNISPDWTLEGSNTAYWSTKADPAEAASMAVYHCPLEGAELGIKPGVAYTFQALFGLHRTDGMIRMVFSDAQRKAVQAFETPIPQTSFGGRKAEDYALGFLTARAPAQAVFLRIEIVKGQTSSGTDSFLFFTHPALTRTGECPRYEWLDNSLPAALTTQLFGGSLEHYYALSIALPGETLDGFPHTVAVRNRTSGTSSNSVQVSLPDGARCRCIFHGMEGSTLVGRIELPASWKTRISLSLWVDGHASGQTYFSEPAVNAMRLPLPVSACDGRPHLFELRLGATGQSLGQYAGIGPVGLTPWDALQKYAGMPLPSQSAPLASYRYASIAAADHGAMQKSGLTLHELHDIIVEGFDSLRKEFKPLPFPKVKDPEVSIVIPAHNKFDVTYVCLASLLFAANKCSFEVIVVDDGSSDTTTRLPEIAPGVVYVRNEKALGFVGACNAGADQARGRYIVFLNNDTEPTAYWLDELLYVFKNFDDVGLAGSKLIYPDGPLQEAGGIVWETGDPWNYGRRANPFDPRYSYSRICDYLSGAAIMIPADLWKELGGFSREFAPAYFEDTDLAFKVKNAGKKVVFTPSSLVVHYEGLSNGTDKTASSGLKRYQEINRPKFKRKWSALFAGNGKVGKDLDLAKDRGVTRRVVFFDAEFPRVDRDAGSYAAIQEIRMFQALGFKVTFVPTNMAYLGRHTTNLQRLGVETIHSPFFPDIATFIKERGAEFDVAYITRYGVAEQVLGPLQRFAKQARVIVNVADLHFLRQIRDAMVERSAPLMEAALKTREAEIAVLSKAELVLSYSAIEQAVITSHVVNGPKTGIIPWVIDPQPLKAGFKQRQDVAFLGGFGHTPNIAAVKFFADEVMPLLRMKLPGVRFMVYGSAVPPEIEALASDDVIIKGYVRDVSEVFDSCRVFVAPLLSGAGMKGKVLDCISAGLPSVLSPIAAEGIGMRDGMDTIIANRPEDWVAAIARLYDDEAAWTAMSKSVHALAESRYSFRAGIDGLREALGSIELFLTGDTPALHVNSARPDAPRYTMAAWTGTDLVPAVKANK